MPSVFNPIVIRALSLLGLLGLGLAQVGCAHPVTIEPSVVVHSRMGHAPVYAQIRVPGPVFVMPPPRVIHVPQVYGPFHGWERHTERRHGHRHDRRDWSHDRSRPHPSDEGGRRPWGGGYR